MAYFSLLVDQLSTFLMGKVTIVGTTLGKTTLELLAILDGELKAVG